MKRWTFLLAALVIFAAVFDFAQRLYPQGMGFGWSASSVDTLELKPGTLQPGATPQATVASNAAAIAQWQIGADGVSGGPAQGPYAETWPPIKSVQEGSAASPFHNAVGAATWANPDLDLYNGSFNAHDEWWNAAGGYENICVIGGNDSGVSMGNAHFYGITSVDFYADASDITGPSAPITVTKAIGYPHTRTITGGSEAGSSLAALTISPTFPFAPGEQIQISGATGSSAAYNGDWLVAPPDPNGVYGQQVGTLTMSTVNGGASIPAGTPAPVGATVVSTEPLYWCAHVYPKDYPDGFHQFRAVVHYLNGWTSVLETAKAVDAIDTADNEGILTEHGGFGWTALLSQLSFLPQTNFGQSNTYDCLVPGVSYTPIPPVSGGNPYWGNVLPAYHWLGDDQFQIAVNQTYTMSSGSISANGSIAQFQVPHTIAANAAPYLTNGSTVNTSFTIPSVTTAAANITPAGTTATLASLSTAITVNNGDQVTLSGLTNPTYTVSGIVVSSGVATATLSGTGSSDVLAPTSTVAGESVTISISGTSFPGGVSGVSIKGVPGAPASVTWSTSASAGSYTGGTLSFVSGGGWNQRLNTGSNSSGTVVVEFPDGESYSVAPTGTASVLWNQDQQYRVASYSFNTTANYGANETITVSPPGGQNVTFVPGQVVYLTGLPSIVFNPPTQSQTTTQSLNGNPTGGTSGVFATIISAPSANTFTFYGTSIGIYYGYTISAISMSGTTETVSFTVPGITGTQPTIPTGSHINVLNPLTSASSSAQPQLSASDVVVTASSAGSVSFTNASGSGTAAYGTLQVLDGTYANSWSGTIAVATPNPSERVTSDLSVQWVESGTAGVGMPTYPHPGVQLSSMTVSSGVATAQYPTNIVTPAGMTITGTGNVKLVSFKQSISNPSLPCQDSNIIISPLTDGVNGTMPYGEAQSPETFEQWQSLWANISSNGNMYTPISEVDNHQNSSDPNPNQYNITGLVSNGDGTATATFVGDVAVPVGSSIFVSNSISADPNVDGFNTLAFPPQAISSSITGTSVSFNPDSSLSGCSGSPTVTLTYGGSTNFFPTNVWLKVEGLTNTAAAPYTNAWNGQFQECNAAAGAVSYIVPPALTGTPAWTGTGTVVAAPTGGVYPAIVTASSAGSPDSTVTYDLPSPTNATPSTWVSGGTIDIADCGQDGVNADDCTTIEGALWSLHRTGQPNYNGSTAGVGYNMTLTSPPGFTNVETFSTTYNINGAWTINGNGTCTFLITVPGAAVMPVGSQVDVSGPATLTGEYIQSSTQGAVNNPKITINCPGVVSATGGTVAWHSEYKVGMPLTTGVGSSVLAANIALGVYPNQPYFIEASTGPGTAAGTLIAPGGSFLLSATPGGPPLTGSSSGSLAITQNLEDLSTVCLKGPSGSSTTPSSAQYYQLGDAADNGLVNYANKFGWTMIESCSGSNPHATIGQSSGQWGTGVQFTKVESIDLCAHTSLNSLAYCSLNDASIYGNTNFNLGPNSGYGLWFDNTNLYGFSGYIGGGGPTSGTSQVGVANYITHQYTINNFYPNPVVSDSYNGSEVSDLEYINQSGQLANWSLYDHEYFDGMPGSGYNNAFACANSGAPGWPNIAGCSNPQGTVGTGIWTGGVGSGVRNPFGTCSSGGCDPANTTGCNGAGAATFGCNIVPIAQIQRDVQSLQSNAGSSYVPTSWTQSGGGPFLDYSTYSSALNLQFSANPTATAWVDYSPSSPPGSGTGLLLTGANAGKTFTISWPSGSTSVDICSEDRACFSACFDATQVNPFCPEGQAQFIAAGCDVQVSGVYDPTHSTSCIQLNNINTTSVPDISNKTAITCSVFGTSGSAPALCNGTSNPSDTWEEIFPQSGSGTLTSSIFLWNGAHLDIVFIKINPNTAGDVVFNALVTPLADPSCRISSLQLYPIVCNGAVGLAFEELAYMGPVAMFDSAGWLPSGIPGLNNDNKFFKNSQFENSGSASFSNPDENSQLTVDTINPQPASGRVFDNSTCWDGPSGQTNTGSVYQVGSFVHPIQENGFSYLESLPTSEVSVSGTTATLTFSGIPFTPLIPPGSLIHVAGLTGGLADANTDANPNSINGNGNYYTLTTAGSVPGTVQFAVPTGMDGLSQTSGITLDWPYATFFNSPPYSTVYSISSISWITSGAETITYTSTDNLPIQYGSTVTIAGAATPAADFAGRTKNTSAGTISVVNPELIGTSGSESETSATATFTQACQW